MSDGAQATAASSPAVPVRGPRRSLKEIRSWTFLTNHAQVLLAVARNPSATVDEIEGAAQISRRSAFRILADLQHAGYVRRVRHGRRNRYEINRELPLEDPLVEKEPLGDLIALVAGGAGARG